MARTLRLSDVPTPKLIPSVGSDHPAYQLSVSLNELINIVARRLTLGKLQDGETLGNFGSTQVVEFTSPVLGSVEVSVIHGLGRVPYGRIVLRQDAPGILHDVYSKWDKTKAVFKSTRGSTYYKIVLL